MSEHHAASGYQKIRDFLASRTGATFALAWGLAEATVFFVIPDVLLGFAVLFFPIYGLLFCGLAVAGALVGGSVMFLLGKYHAAFALGLLSHIPGISEKMIAAVQADFHVYGLKAMFVAPWQGIPYKIYAVQAGMGKIPFLAFLAASIPARLERFFLVVLIAAVLGKAFQKNIAKNSLAWVWAYVILWIGIYAQYILTLMKRWGG
jgi:membrane protein YqaA with SNARE-associated domain